MAVEQERYCLSCGAPVEGKTCHYCGTPAPTADGEVGEHQSLEHLHHALANAENDAKKERILRNAFLPEDPDVAVDAGLRCMPLVDASTKVGEAAGARVETIITKLEMLDPSPHLTRAIGTLKTELKKRRQKTRHIPVKAIVWSLVGLLFAGGYVVHIVMSEYVGHSLAHAAASHTSTASTSTPSTPSTPSTTSPSTTHLGPMPAGTKVQTIDGSLAAGDSKLKTGEYYDKYKYSWPAGAHVRIEATSSDFDTYIILKLPSKQQLENDDSNGGTNSVVDLTTPDSGMFEVMLTSSRPGETGSYHMTISTPP